MEDSHAYGVTMLVVPPTTPTCLAELTAVAHTTEAGQQRYYKAEEVEALLATLTPKWVTIGGALSSASNLPQVNEKVLLELVSGTYAVGQLCWTYRWLLQGGASLLLQEVVRWKLIVPATETVKGGQQGA
jgi:hypothetical protein